VGEAISLAIGTRTQKEVAEAIGEAPSTITRWVQNKAGYTPGYEDLARIETVCRLPLGYILHAAGFIADVKTVPEAIAMAPELDDPARVILMQAYEALVSPE
jgi:transcriptional regulator with XRE-family HTH domain